MKDNAKLRETEEKIRRAKEAQEKRDREKVERTAAKNAIVDVSGGMNDSQFSIPLYPTKLTITVCNKRIYLGCNVIVNY